MLDPSAAPPYRWFTGGQLNTCYNAIDRHVATGRADEDALMYDRKPVGTPDAGEFWRVIQEHHVRVLFTTPTAFRAIKREDPEDWWQTETSWPVAANKEGAVTLRLPLPPGTLPTLWRDDARYISTYLARYPGHYLTGDGGYIDEDGYLFIMGQVDDIIIVAGHNLSTGAMEQALASHPDVAACAVIGVRDPLKTQLPVGLVVLKAGLGRVG